MGSRGSQKKIPAGNMAELRARAGRGGANGKHFIGPNALQRCFESNLSLGTNFNNSNNYAPNVLN